MLYERSPRHLIVIVQALPDKYRRLLPDVPRYHKEGLDRVVLNQKFIDVIVNASASAFQSNASVSGPGPAFVPRGRLTGCCRSAAVDPGKVVAVTPANFVGYHRRRFHACEWSRNTSRVVVHRRRSSRR